MYLVELIFILFCMLLICLFIEKLFHMKYSLTECAGQLRADIIQICKIFLYGEEPQGQIPQTRYGFESFFENHMRNIIKPYANEVIGIAMQNVLYNGVPSISIVFAPASDCTDTDIKKLKRLLLSELWKYSCARGGLYRDMFADSSQDDTYVYIVLYYVELEADFEPFQRRKQIYIEERKKPKENILRDESLDKELSAVESQDEDKEHG